jgi:hypothetical protein
MCFRPRLGFYDGATRLTTPRTAADSGGEGSAEPPCGSMKGAGCEGEEGRLVVAEV